MRPTASQHPSADELAAFGRGSLGPAAATWVRHHLNECPACRAAAGDPFGTIAEMPFATASVTKPASSGSVLDELPPALRDHSRYHVIRQLGRGGMGVVYLTEHRVMERPVAVKVISRSLVERPESLERFRREVRAAARLDHPNIVKAYDAEQAGDLHLLAMEYVEGNNLAAVIAEKGPLPIALACHYVRQAALGLQHAFELGMVHRDLKPQNLMLTPSGTVKILDFGLAKLASEQSRPGGGLTQDHDVMGTPEYMAPEQALNTKNADIRADIYSLGCTLYCLLAGQPPFSADSSLAVIIAHAQQEPPPVESLRADLPAPLSALVRRMLAKNPNDRPQTPKEVADALAPFARPAMSAEDATTILTNVFPVHQPPRRRRWLLPGIVVAAVTLVAIGLLAGTAFKGRSNEGLLVIEVNEPNPIVFVDGIRKNPKWTDGGKTTVVHVKPGAHKVEVKKDGFAAVGSDFDVAERAREKFTAVLKPQVKRLGVDELEQAADDLRKLNYAQAPLREKRRQHALEEVKAALTAIESDVPAADSEIGGHLDRVHADIAELNAVSVNSPLNKTALADAVRSLDAAIAARMVSKGDARLATIFNGQWSIDRQDIIQSQPTGLANIRFGNPEWTDYDFSCDVQLVRGTGHAAAVFRTVQHLDAYFYRVVASPTAADSVFHAHAARQGTVLISHEHSEATLQPDRWRAMRVRVRGNQCWCYLDDADWLHCENLVNAQGRVGLQTFDAACRFRNIRVADADGVVLWRGPPTLPAQTQTAITPVANDTAPPKLVSLFNGKNLDGWEPFPGGTAEWTVEDGVIVGRGHGYLFSKRGDYGDFHIRVEAKASPGANSGVFFHMPFSINPLNGYEAQIDAGNDPYPTGSLYGIAAAPRSLAPADQWFTMEVISIGPRIQILINGKETVNYTDPKPRSLKGFFALQQLLPGREIRFRKVEVEELR